MKKRTALILSILSLTLILGCTSQKPGEESTPFNDNAQNIRISLGLAGSDGVEVAGGSFDLRIVLNDTDLPRVSLFTRNLSGVSLYIQSVGFSGSEASEFSQSGLVPNTALAIDEAIDFSVRLNPETIGEKHALLTIVFTNDSGKVYQLGLQLKGESLYGNLPPLPPTAISISSSSNALVQNNSCVPLNLSLQNPRGDSVLTRSGKIGLSLNTTVYVNSICTQAAAKPVEFDVATNSKELFLRISGELGDTLIVNATDVANNLESDSISFGIERGAVILATASEMSGKSCHTLLRGQSTQIQITMSNVGDVTATELELLFGQPVTQSGNCSETLAPGQSCVATLEWTPEFSHWNEFSHLNNGPFSGLPLSLKYNPNTPDRSGLSPTPLRYYNWQLVETWYQSARDTACNMITSAPGLIGVAKLSSGEYVVLQGSKFKASKVDSTGNLIATFPVPIDFNVEGVNYVGRDGSGNIYAASTGPIAYVIKLNPATMAATVFDTRSIAPPLYRTRVATMDINSNGDLVFVLSRASPANVVSKSLVRLTSSLIPDTEFDTDGTVPVDWSYTDQVHILNDKTVLVEEYPLPNEHIEFSASGQKSIVASPYIPAPWDPGIWMGTVGNSLYWLIGGVFGLVAP